MSDTNSNITSNNNNSGPYRYKEAVRCIAIIDICIAFFMLTFLSLRFFSSSLFYRQLYPKELFVISNDSPNVFTIITIALIIIYGLQLGMAQLLLSATYQTDVEIIMARCQKWYWFSIHLNVVLGIELLLLIFAVRDEDGGKRFPIPAIICLVKMIFRSTGNHVVKIFLWDLRTRTGVGVGIFPNLDALDRNTIIIGGGTLSTSGAAAAAAGLAHANYPFEPRGEFANVSIPKYEHPPSYEEAIKEKPPYFQHQQQQQQQHQQQSATSVNDAANIV